MSFTKLTYTCILFFLLISLSGYQLYFALQLQEAKSDMRREIANGHAGFSTTKFMLDKNEFSRLSWTESDEFIYKGQSFDVISKDFKNGVLTILCIADERETDLVYNFTRSQNSGSNHESSDQLLKLLSALYFPAEMPALQNFHSDTLIHNDDFICNYRSHVPSLDTAPPWL